MLTVRPHCTGIFCKKKFSTPSNKNQTTKNQILKDNTLRKLFLIVSENSIKFKTHDF